MKTRQNGKQTFLFTEEEYQTEINIHNFTGRPVTFRMRAAKANPIGAEPGRVSDVIERRLAPYQAMQVNCKSIARLLGKVRDHEVCDGKGQAQAVIEEIEGLLGDTAFDSTSTSAQLAYPAIERLIKALDKAIELEEDGKANRLVDGFVSIRAGEEEGTMTTRIIEFSGQRRLIANASAKGGYVIAEVLDRFGKPLAGYGRHDCVPLEGDFLESEIDWKTGKSLTGLVGKPIRLRFIMKNADLYSFRLTKSIR